MPVDPGSRVGGIEAVIAVRGGPAGKSRLAERLAPAEREALVAAMLVDMLAALARCPSVERVRVTTPTPALAEAAHAAGALVTKEGETGDLNAAFEAVRREIAATTPDKPVLFLPGDLPLIEPAQIERLVRAAGPGRIALAPAQADGGTAALVAPAGLPLDLAFGDDSFTRHRAAAGRLGVAVETLRLPSLGLDIDRPADIDEFHHRGGGGQTARALAARLSPLSQDAAA